jgi:hypothetical protein
MPKKAAAAPSVSHIIVGFSFPSEQNPQEVITGTTRHSIWLAMSSQLYTLWATNAGMVTKEDAKKMADAAFELTDIYLKKLDIEAAKAVPPSPPTPPPPQKSNSPFS